MMIRRGQSSPSIRSQTLFGVIPGHATEKPVMDQARAKNQRYEVDADDDALHC
jgi:hypothetical protein